MPWLAEKEDDEKNRWRWVERFSVVRSKNEEWMKRGDILGREIEMSREGGTETRGVLRLRGHFGEEWEDVRENGGSKSVVTYVSN
jgi:hypothetical protein